MQGFTVFVTWYIELLCDQVSSCCYSAMFSGWKKIARKWGSSHFMGEIYVVVTTAIVL